MMTTTPCGIMLRATILLCCLLSLTFPGTALLAQEGKRRNQMRMRQSEPNVLAPELYLDHLKLKITLVDLPGAANPKSSWEGTYQLYFVPEAEFDKALQEAVRRVAPNRGGGAVSLDLDVSNFPKKTLLAEGNFKKSALLSLKDRTFVLDRIAFRAKVPEAERTKEAKLLLSYSVKIFDAQLKQTIYRTRMWTAQAPLMEDANDSGRDVARTTVYANLYVTKTGDIYESQWTREGEDTSW